jgi:hypothetical protein
MTATPKPEHVATSTRLRLPDKLAYGIGLSAEGIKNNAFTRNGDAAPSRLDRP